MRKTLVVSAGVPPRLAGVPIILGRLLKEFPRGSYYILTSIKSTQGNVLGERLPASYNFVDKPRVNFEKRYRGVLLYKFSNALFQFILRKFLSGFSALYNAFAVKREAINIIKRNPVDRILGISDDGPFFLGAYLASRKSKLPLHVILFDLYAHNNFNFQKQLVANFMEGKIIKHATKVFVTNTKTRDYYQKLYGVKAIVIEHPVAIPHPVEARVSRKNEVVFTGSIYWAQHDAVVNLAKAIKFVPKAYLKLFTSVNKPQLRKMGVSGDKISIGFGESEEILREQRQADILFLPMGFKTPAPEITQTATPGKLPEYLISGVPILVHAAPDSYISEDAKKYGWGMVVDKSDPEVLAAGIKRLLSDNKLRKKLVSNAFKVAKKRHNDKLIAAQFLNHFR